MAEELHLRAPLEPELVAPLAGGEPAVLNAAAARELRELPMTGAEAGVRDNLHDRVQPGDVPGESVRRRLSPRSQDLNVAGDVLRDLAERRDQLVDLALVESSSGGGATDRCLVREQRRLARLQPGGEPVGFRGLVGGGLRGVVRGDDRRDEDLAVDAAFRRVLRDRRGARVVSLLQVPQGVEEAVLGLLHRQGHAVELVVLSPRSCPVEVRFSPSAVPAEKIFDCAAAFPSAALVATSSPTPSFRAASSAPESCRFFATWSRIDWSIAPCDAFNASV